MTPIHVIVRWSYGIACLYVRTVFDQNILSETTQSHKIVAFRDRQTETERQRDRQRQTDRQRDRQIQTDRQIQRERQRDRDRQTETETDRQSFGCWTH